MNVYKLMAGLLVATASLLSVACSDTQYTRETYAATPHDDTEIPSRTVETTFAKDGSLRTETVQHIGTSTHKVVTLTLCREHKQITFSPDLKMYSIVPLREKDKRPAGENVKTDTSLPSSNLPQGKITIFTTVKDLGEEVVAGVKARHYLVVENWHRSGSAGSGVQPHTTEVWVAPNLKQPWYCEAEQLEPERSTSANGSHSGQTIVWEKKGDVAARAKTFKGWNLRTKWYQFYDGKEKMLTISEVTALSFAKLSSSLFTCVAPTDFQQVSEPEFREAQGKLMEEAAKQHQVRYPKRQ